MAGGIIEQIKEQIHASRGNIVLALVALGAIIILILALRNADRPVVRHTGTIESFRPAETDVGTEILAAVRLEDGRVVFVQVHPGMGCKTGMPVPIIERHVAIGTRTSLAPEACIR